MDESASDDFPTIAVQAHGPYMISGRLRITRRAIVESQFGEPMTWRTTEDLGSPTDAWLCRCGGSRSKPFCDDSHLSNGFVGAEAAPTSTYNERAERLGGAGMVIRKDQSICEHTGFCGNRFEGIRAMATSLNEDNTAQRALLMAMIEHCPSGSLTFKVIEADLDVEPELRLGVGVTEDGPYFITGGVAVERADGEPFESRNRMTLCRCGGSAMMPRCDGTHRSNGFHDA